MTEVVKVNVLKHTENNVRLHTEKQIEALKDSVERFTQYRPIVVDEHNNVLAGNGLLMAMKALGRQEVEVKRLTGLTKSEKKALVVADNRTYDLGYSDEANILRNLEQIELGDIVGYTSEEVADLLDIEIESLDEVTEEAEEIKEVASKPKKLKYLVCPCCDNEYLESEMEVRLKVSKDD